MRFIERKPFWSPAVCFLAVVYLIGPGMLFGAKQQGQKAGEARNDNGLKMTFVWCPPGKFSMGSPKSDGDRSDDESPVQVTITRGFWLGQTEVTQGQWQSVMGTTPWRGNPFVKEGTAYPVTYLSWQDAIAFCQKLTEQERQAGRLPDDWAFTLPTEAQWEYACRADTKTAYSFGDDKTKLGDYAWFKGNADQTEEDYPHQVGTKKSNPWGLLDMHGNVFEWCRDWYDPKLPGGRDALVNAESFYRVYRGGCWSCFPKNCRSACRGWCVPSNRGFGLGFRVAQVPTQKPDKKLDK